MKIPGAWCQDQMLLQGTGTNPVGTKMNGPDGIWHRYRYLEDSGPEHNEENTRHSKKTVPTQEDTRPQTTRSSQKNTNNKSKSFLPNPTQIL